MSNLILELRSEIFSLTIKKFYEMLKIEKIGKVTKCEEKNIGKNSKIKKIKFKPQKIDDFKIWT